MKRNEIISEIIDFHEGRGRFSARKDYWGMAGSSVDELFAWYFDTLPAATKRQVARVLVAGALGHVKELIPYLANTMHLLLGLCIRGYATSFLGKRTALEDELNRPTNLTIWAMSDNYPRDQAFLPPDLAYKREWRYALALLTVLRYLDSAQTAEAFQYLRANAQAPHFREALDGYEFGWLGSFEEQ